jgi:predicted  nucleic acid-binding Zn-ribbon protein
MIELSVIMPWLSLAVALITVQRFFAEKRTRAIEEGKMQSKYEQLRSELDRACREIDCIKVNSRAVDIDVAELKRDIKHIMESLDRIENKLP